MKLLGISGSLRRESLNTALVRAAAEAFAPTRFTLADLNLPLYDGDVEARGMPEAALALNAAIRDADAIVIATPEYNAGLSGVLKNALDWSSRVKPMPLTGKPVAILSAAAGRAGGQRAQMTLRHCLLAFDTRLVQAPQVFVHASAFEGGGLTDETTRDLVAKLMARLRAEAARCVG
ncbi:MAG: NADPH-dependent FMN reductase [Alphaproteobacteria bacterium HGW-Alphaproteobacteria-8]|nr:MAG: NADPH-dependent FMN reductase [Alphaproteobacteria bacterium HGW-Alphaproteobacteria-8]